MCVRFFIKIKQRTICMRVCWYSYVVVIKIKQRTIYVDVCDVRMLCGNFHKD